MFQIIIILLTNISFITDIQYFLHTGNQPFHQIQVFFEIDLDRHRGHIIFTLPSGQGHTLFRSQRLFFQHHILISGIIPLSTQYDRDIRPLTIQILTQNKTGCPQ